MTITWIIGGAAAGVLAGSPVRAGVLARYAVEPPALAVEAAAALCGFYLALFIVRPSGMGLGDLLTEQRRRSPQAGEHQVTHLGMPDFRPSAGRSSGAAGGP